MNEEKTNIKNYRYIYLLQDYKHYKKTKKMI